MDKQLMIKIINEYIEFKLLAGVDRISETECQFLFNKYLQHKKKKK